MEIVEQRKLEREIKIRSAIEYSKALDFKSTVILIGSYARGDFNLWSDVDLLIIGDFSGNPVRRSEKLDFPAGYELILLTPEEISIMKGKRNKFLIDSFAEGVVLRDDFQYFS
ncbi:MAG: nucleotidyltransferase domain-containing protein [Thermoplasmataceae archaeon]